MGLGHTRQETHFLIIKYEQIFCLAFIENFLFNPKTNFMVNKLSMLLKKVKLNELSKLFKVTQLLKS